MGTLGGVIKVVREVYGKPRVAIEVFYKRYGGVYGQPWRVIGDQIY